MELKNRLTSAPVLAYPRDKGLFVLDTDASQYEIGAVFFQVQDREEVVMGYFSKTLGKAERNYCVTRNELAVVRSIEQYHSFLYSREFLVRTDHSAFQWLLNVKNPEGQNARWLENLQS